MTHTLGFSISGRRYDVTITPDHLYDPNLELIVSMQLGIPDRAIVEVLTRVVRPGDTVLDGGANIGYFTMLLSQAVGASGRVFAVEPGSNNLDRLKRNIMTNECRNTTVIDVPLWGSEKPVALYMGENGGVNSLVKHNDVDENNFIMLDAVTLKRFVPCRFMKLDIEGAEPEALSALTGTADCPYIVAELNETALQRFNSNQMSFRNLMSDRGYSTFIIRDDGGLPVLVPPQTRLACARANTNVLFSTPELVGQVWSLIAV